MSGHRRGRSGSGYPPSSECPPTSGNPPTSGHPTASASGSGSGQQNPLPARFRSDSGFRSGFKWKPVSVATEVQSPSYGVFVDPMPQHPYTPGPQLGQVQQDPQEARRQRQTSAFHRLEDFQAARRQQMNLERKREHERAVQQERDREGRQREAHVTGRSMQQRAAFPNLQGQNRRDRDQSTRQREDHGHGRQGESSGASGGSSRYQGGPSRDERDGSGRSDSPRDSDGYQSSGYRDRRRRA